MTNDPRGASDHDDKDRSQTSLTDKVVDSASGLLRDFFAPNGNEVGETLSRSLADRGKPTSSSNVSSASSTRGGESSFSSGQYSSASSVPEDFQALGTYTRNPTMTTERQDGMLLDRFLRDEPDWHGLDLNQDFLPNKGKAAVYNVDSFDPVEDKKNSMLHTIFSHVPCSRISSEFPSVAPEDGADVVTLLSDRDFQPDAEGPTPANNAPYTMSGDETRAAEFFVQHFDGRFLGMNRVQKALSAAQNGRPYREFSSFFDDVEAYQEDVWGYLQPLVVAARQEVENAGLISIEDGPATRRLRMILSHLSPTS